jgi:hypothetical protein
VGYPGQCDGAAFAPVFRRLAAILATATAGQVPAIMPPAGAAHHRHHHATTSTAHPPVHQGRVAIHLPRERFGHLTTPSEAHQIHSLIDWDFANACMVGHAAKRLEDIRTERKAAAAER